MSEFTEAILDGIFCELCGVVIDFEAPGHPRRCEDCPPVPKTETRRRIDDLMAQLKAAVVRTEGEDDG